VVRAAVENRLRRTELALAGHLALLAALAVRLLDQ